MGSNDITSKYNNNTRDDHNDHDTSDKGVGKSGRHISKWRRYMASWSIASILIYIGSLPILLQKTLVVAPLPFFCSFATMLILAIFHLPPYIYLPISCLFLALLLYSVYRLVKFIFKWVEQLQLQARQDDTTRENMTTDVNNIRSKRNNNTGSILARRLS